jgi:hypothetical protein
LACPSQKKSRPINGFATPHLGRIHRTDDVSDRFERRALTC